MASPRCCTAFTCRVVVASFFFVLGCLLLVSAFYGHYFITDTVKSGIRDQVIVDSKSATGYSTWRTNTHEDDAPTYLTFYVYNITNSYEVMYEGAFASVEELGPYVYQSYKTKFNITFEDGGEKATYQTYEYFVFDENLTPDHLNPKTDQITGVNIPFQAVLASLAGGSGLSGKWYLTLLFDLLVSKAGVSAELFGSYTPEQIAFGYYDPLLEFVSTLLPGTPSYYPGIKQNFTSLEEAQNSSLFDTTYTGKGNLSRLAEYYSYQGNTTLTIWGSPEANHVRGTDGTAYPPDVDKTKSLPTFVDTITRSTNLVYNHSHRVHGVLLYGFVLPEKDLLNASLVPENAQYYSFGPSGVLNMTSQSEGAPIFASKPHFLDADPWYASRLQNLTPPIREEHDTVISVEPQTGVVMDAAKRLQLNVHLLDVFGLYPNVTESYVPVAWAIESGQVTKDQAQEFKDSVYRAEAIAKWGRISLPIIGGFLLLVSIAIIADGIRKRRQQMERANIEEEPFLAAHSINSQDDFYEE